MMKKRITAVMMMSALTIGVLSPMGEAQMAGIRLSKTSLALSVGESAALKVKGTSKKVTWSSTKKAVAKVTKKGKVTAVSAGKAVIRAKVAKKTLKCKVTVTKIKALTNYWTDNSNVAEELRNYVDKVTDEKDTANYIPKEDRIAVFDMDGTLICEQFFTYYDTMMFVEFCLKDHPEKVSDELKKVAGAIAPGYTADESLARNFAKAYAGMSVKELYDYAVEFGKKPATGFCNMRYSECAYLPMVEAVQYLYDNDFTIYVVSGTERTTSRAIIDNSLFSDYVDHEHVIGTEFEVKVKGHENVSSDMDYKYVPGDELVFTGGFVRKNLNAAKTIAIEREIGKKPVLAFGNSGSDTSMMDYTLDSNKYPSAAFMVVADDDEEEWGKTSNWENKTPDYIKAGYIPVSMKNDFAQTYPKGVVKAAAQTDAGVLGVGPDDEQPVAA